MTTDYADEVRKTEQSELPGEEKLPPDVFVQEMHSGVVRGKLAHPARHASISFQSNDGSFVRDSDGKLFGCGCSGFIDYGTLEFELSTPRVPDVKRVWTVQYTLEGPE